METLGTWERHLAEPFRGRQVICAFEVLAAMTKSVADLRRWGARRPLLIPHGIGTGPLVSSDDADVLLLAETKYASLTDNVRARLDPDGFVTAEVIDAVESYDPDGSAVWWFGAISPNDTLLDRPVLGGRPRTQIALEDKLIVDDLLQRVGGPRLVRAIAPATYDELSRASDDVRESAGVSSVVWAGDARDGINGAGDYVRWVRNDTIAHDAANFFGANCDHVLVTPFLEGVPCSIHGLVLPDGVVVLRPVELASLRNLETGRFSYGGMGTTWDPPATVAAEMRTLASAVGADLRQRFGYRGAFGIDGVVTADGFRVTELNPRFSGGMTRLATAAPDSHLELVQVNSLIGRDVVRPAQEIEEGALAELEANRFIDVVGLTAAVTVGETTVVPVAAGETSLVAALDGTGAIGSAMIGPSPMGAFIRLVLDADTISIGQRCASLAVLLYAFADETWDSGFGDVLMPVDVSS